MSLNLVFSRSCIYPCFLLLLSLFALILCVLFLFLFPGIGSAAGASRNGGGNCGCILSPLLFFVLSSLPFPFPAAPSICPAKKRRGKGRDVHFSPGLQIGAKFGKGRRGQKRKMQTWTSFSSRRKKKALGTKYQGWAYREIREGGKL